MNFLKPALSITFALSMLAGASVLDAAKANDADNPYLPKPAASTETADHGQALYCVKGRMIPGWTCDQELSLNGDGVQPTIHYTPKPTPAPPSPPSCDHGDKSKV